MFTLSRIFGSITYSVVISLVCFSCIPVPEAEEKPTQQITYSVPESVYKRPPGIKLMDTTLQGLEIYIQKIPNFVDIYITCSDTTAFSSDSNTYRNFKLSFTCNKKKIRFPYSSLTKGNYTAVQNYNDNGHWSPDHEYPARRRAEWHIAIPAFYFAKLKEGVHLLNADLETITTAYGKKAKQDDGKNPPLTEYGILSEKSTRVKFPLTITLPPLYLKKLVVGETYLEERNDYDGELYSGPDCYFCVFSDTNSFFRSGTASESFHCYFDDTTYYFTEKMPKKLTVSFYDEDVAFDDELGGFNANLTYADKVVRLKSGGRIRQTQYWVSREFKAN